MERAGYFERGAIYTTSYHHLLSVTSDTYDTSQSNMHLICIQPNHLYQAYLEPGHLAHPIQL
jgi:hypothetical protein